MTIPEILSALEKCTGTFPEAAIRAAIDKREEITLTLLEALQKVADDAPRLAQEDDYMLHLFALYLLAQFREKRVFPILIKLISWPEKTADDLLGETIADGLASLLASVFNGNLEALARVVLNDEANEFARSSVIDAMALLYLENIITREQIVTAFRRLYRELRQDGDPQPWNGLVGATADAGLQELLPELREAFEKGLVGGSYDDLEDCESRLCGPRERVIANFKRHNHLIEDAIEEMSWWAAFDDNKLPIKDTEAVTEEYANTELPAQLAMSGESQPPRFITAVPKIGRNEPCPCGSGKKYKKCCLGKTNESSQPASPQRVEPRFMSPASSYYTQGALMEALKPDGMVKINPYVLVKLRDAPRMIEGALPEDRARLLRLWRPSRLAAMTTDEIELKLGLLGVQYERDQFQELAKSRRSAWEIAEEWSAPLIALGRPEKDFCGLAACELWRRLCPQGPSLEMIDDWLCEGYGLAGEKNPAEALAAWWKVWEALRPRLTPEMKNLNEADERLFDGMSQCLSNWSTDLCHEALNGSLKDPRCAEIGIRFIRELLEAFPEEDEHLNYRGDLADLYFRLKRDSEAEQCCEHLIQKYPDRSIGYVMLSAGLLEGRCEGAVDSARVERAVGLLERALTYPVTDAEDFDLRARLADARNMLSGAPQLIRSTE